MPGAALPVVLERIINAQTIESENTETHVFSVYISMASVNEKRVRLSAQFLSLSASAAYNALPYIIEHIFINFTTLFFCVSISFKQLNSWKVWKSIKIPTC